MNGWWLVSSIKGERKGGKEMDGVAEVCIHLLILHIHLSILYFLTYQKDHSFKACKIMFDIWHLHLRLNSTHSHSL